MFGTHGAHLFQGAKRKLQGELQDAKVSSAAASAKHSELTEAVKAYRAKAENYLTRLEQNEIERAKAANGEAFGELLNHLYCNWSVTL